MEHLVQSKKCKRCCGRINRRSHHVSGSQRAWWKTSRLGDCGKIPWGILILFAAGIAIAHAFVESGISSFIGGQLTVLARLHPLIIIGAIALVVTFLTETTSNTATTVLLMPILATAGVAAGVDPSLMMVPAAMSASLAFMLPVATAPNAIIFSTGKVPITEMAREGLALNFIGAAVITVVCYFIVA